VNKNNPLIATPQTTYPPVGICIYCGSDGGKDGLRKEHIIPYGLNGNFILPKSSCKKCEAVTSAFEGYYLGNMMMKPIRHSLRMQSSKKHVGRKDLLLPYIKTERFYADKAFMPIEEYPSTLFLYQLGPADFIEGLAPSTDFRESRAWSYSHDPQKQEKLFQVLGARRIYLAAFNAMKFSSMLAKIAYAFAVADLGYKNIRPFVLDTIFEKDKTPSYWIGGNKELAPPTDFLHQMRIEYIRKPLDFDGRVYILVHLRLFANLGAPEYHVVVGEKLNANV